MNLSFVTSVKFLAGTARVVNNMTFLVNPCWYLNTSDIPTLPISFFHIVKQTEVGKAQISQKPLFFYQADKKATSGSQTGSAVTSIVADNIVNQPKQWKLQVLVPHHPTQILDQYYFDASTAASLAKIMFDPNGEGFIGGLQQVAMVSRIGEDIVKQLIKIMTADTSTSITSGFLSAALNENTINKDSLEAMLEQRGIMKMKLWNGWKFAWVAIVDYELHKSNDYQGFYEGNIIVQDVPIMTVQGTQTNPSMRTGLFNLLGKSTLSSLSSKISSLRNTILQNAADNVGKGLDN